MYPRFRTSFHNPNMYTTVARKTHVCLSDQMEHSRPWYSGLLRHRQQTPLTLTRRTRGAIGPHVRRLLYMYTVLWIWADKRIATALSCLLFDSCFASRPPTTIAFLKRVRHVVLRRNAVSHVCCSQEKAKAVASGSAAAEDDRGAFAPMRRLHDPMCPLPPRKRASLAVVDFCTVRVVYRQVYLSPFLLL